jgi:hypothetical protein
MGTLVARAEGFSELPHWAFMRCTSGAFGAAHSFTSSLEIGPAVQHAVSATIIKGLTAAV